MSDTNTTTKPDVQDTKTMLGIRIDKPLREQIKAAAVSEHRTESSFARFHLEKAADEVLAKGAKP